MFRQKCLPFVYRTVYTTKLRTTGDRTRLKLVLKILSLFENEQVMRIAITGSNGFIGSELALYFSTTGNEVLLLQRKEPVTLPKGTTYQHFDLNDIEKLPDLKGADALIHAAYIPSTKKNNSSEANIRGTMALYKACLDNGVQFILLSSLSAHEKALSEYGRHKFALEGLLDKNKCLILKLGLVLGKRGLFSRIKSSVKGSPVSFLVGGGKQPVQAIYIADVAKVIEKCIREKISGTYCIAMAETYSIRELFKLIADSSKRNITLIPVPYWAAELGINMIELLRLPFPVSKENLSGLKQLQAFDTQADLDKLGIKLTGIKESLSLLS